MPYRDKLIRALVSIAIAIALIATTVYLVRAFDSRNMRALDLEHRLTLSTEFQARRNKAMDWSGYLSMEAAIAKELEQALRERSRNASDLNRHARSSKANADNHAINWNRSYKLDPGSVRGSAVLLHGLTDSPYSVRTLAEAFTTQGFVSFVPRLPGHGFVVGDLRARTHRDWSAVVELTVQAAGQFSKDNGPLVIGGYSNGGILALNYALDCQQDPSLPCPDAILLLSPAIAVSPFAALARLHNLLSWLPYFEKFQWAPVNPEVDPYKFTSFPKNAGWQTADLARQVRKKLAASSQPLPPILAFQSVVDATVSAAAVLDFFIGLQPGDHQVVFYDLNRTELFSDWLKQQLKSLHEFETRSPLSFDVTILSNSDDPDKRISEYFLPTGEFQFRVSQTGLEWPKGVYSLSHIALPFPPDDPMYGKDGQAIGTLSPRGEHGMLYVEASYFQRLRFNPFYDYQQGKIVQWLQELTEP
jgi:alpha-beta hydrolase superfamily lysophospholipase